MSTASLSLGQYEQTGREYLFEGTQSLMTIARPGMGKSQAHVIRNLYYLDTAAVVLDVKPEIYAEVGRHREAYFGPSIVFQPGNEEGRSASFNPLDAIPYDPVKAFAAIAQLVPLLMAPTDAKNSKSFWEGRAAQMLQAAIFDVCMNASDQPSRRRDMAAVLDWFSPSSAQLKGTIERLQSSPSRQLVRLGNQLETMDEETRSNLFDSVIRHIDVWGNPELEHLVRETSFDFADFRRDKQTLYLCVTEDELDRYRAVIRALIGQLFYFLRDNREEWSLPSVTFFLDEFPQLGYLPEVERMLALGRQAGLRLWLFAQTTGQIALTYGDADRFIEIMAACCYIQPTGERAHKLSRDLGNVRDPYTGREKPLATAQELMGPEYAERVLVFEGGKPPARLRLVLAVKDPAILKLKAQDKLLLR